MSLVSEQFSGISKILCLYLDQSILFAFRDENGIIRETKMYETADFPRMARSLQLWDPNVCMTFGSKVLDFISANVTENDADTVYTIAYDPSCREITISDPEKDPKLKFVP